MFKMSSSILAIALLATSFIGTATTALADQITTVSTTNTSETVKARKLSNRERRQQLALTVSGSVESRGTSNSAYPKSAYQEDFVTQDPGEFYAAY